MTAVSHQFLRATRASWLIFIVSILTLAGAWSYQLRGYLPCELCLYERWPYYIALVLSLALGLWPLYGVGEELQRFGLLLIALIFLASAAFGIYHVGVEQHWWHGPSTCTGLGNSSSSGDLMEQLKHIKIIACDEVSLRVLGLSLAVWNAVISLALALFALSGLSKNQT